MITLVPLLNIWIGWSWLDILTQKGQVVTPVGVATLAWPSNLNLLRHCPPHEINVTFAVVSSTSFETIFLTFLTPKHLLKGKLKKGIEPLIFLNEVMNVICMRQRRGLSYSNVSDLKLILCCCGLTLLEKTFTGTSLHFFFVILWDC